MPNLLTKAFSKLDIFGSEVGLNYNQDNVFKTTFGGFISLGFIAFIGVFFWSSINQDSFITSPMFNITLETRDYVTYPNGTKVRNKYPVKLEPCTLQHWSYLQSYGNSNWTSLYNQYNFNQFLCPPLDFQFTVGGSYNSEHFFHWKFSVVKCSNKTLPTASWRPVCQSSDAVSAYFTANQNVRFNLYTSNYLINALKNTDYISNYIEDTIFFSFQISSSYITADVFFTDQNVATDQSLLPFQNIENEQYITFTYGNFRTQYVVGPITGSYADFFIRKDSFSYFTDRSFQKISQIISYIGGFSQIFILATAILVNYYNEYIYAVSLANKIYDFQFGNMKKLDEQHKRQKSQKLQQLKGENKYMITDQQHQQQQQQQNNQQKAILPIQSDSFNDNNVISKNTPSNDQKHSSGQLKDVRANKPKRVTNREEDGLLPLDKIKTIIQQRKSLLEQQQFRQSLQNARFSINQIDEEDQRGEKDVIQFSKQQSIQENNEDANSIISSQYEENNSIEMQQQQGPSLRNIKNHKVESKIAMQESVTPESPLKEHGGGLNILQVPKQHKLFDKNEQLPKRQRNESLIEMQKGVTPKSTQFENNNNDNNDLNEIMNQQQQNNNTFQPEFLSIEQLNIASNTTLNQIKSPPFSPMSVAAGATLTTPANKNKQVSQNNLLLQGLGYKDQKQFLTKEFEYILRREATIKMTYKYFLYKLTCGRFFRTEQVLLLDKANQQMKKDLDIFMIVNRIKELEKIKVLFLNKNQETLFNFFPKPIISVHNNEESLSRAELETKIRSKNDTITGSKVKNIKLGGKKLNISFKTAILVSKAVQQFKKPLLRKVDKFDSIAAYQKLYDAYNHLQQSGETSEFNQKLIKLLGDEMNKIFEISNLIQNKGGNTSKNRNIFNPSSHRLIQPNSERMISMLPPAQPTQRNWSQYNNKQQEINSQQDLYSKRNIFSDDFTQIQSTERKL